LRSTTRKERGSVFDRAPPLLFLPEKEERTLKVAEPSFDGVTILFLLEREERVHLDGGSEKCWDEWIVDGAACLRVLLLLLLLLVVVVVGIVLAVVLAVIIVPRGGGGGGGVEKSPIALLTS
jgi:hypothetical protein